jgi:OOP family OmpA-OmpF porin
MEVTVVQPAKILRALVVTLAFSVVAGCAVTGSEPASASAPALAGAWYQIYFDTNKTEIDARGRMIIEKVAYIVANDTATRVTVIGKTDRVGAAADNMGLSHRRANAVRDALITGGVPAAHIDTTWTGEARQNMKTNDDAAEQGNRVVDVTVVKQPH